jgi:hypothetical protein
MRELCDVHTTRWAKVGGTGLAVMTGVHLSREKERGFCLGKVEKRKEDWEEVGIFIRKKKSFIHHVQMPTIKYKKKGPMGMLSR